MRLLNIYTLEFKEFFEKDIPPYHILSHRWSSDEISYEEFCRERIPQKRGYQKVVDFCKFIRHRRRDGLISRRAVDRMGAHRMLEEDMSDLAAHGFEPENDKQRPLAGGEWVWVDTCCIDKRSSAELTEAINSMFKWYGGSYECIVRLTDVPSWEELGMRPPYRKTDTNDRLHELRQATPSHSGYATQFKPQAESKERSQTINWLLGSSLSVFKRSVWFTRGWTLQELLAPEIVVFCNSAWEVYGHMCKSERCSRNMYAYGMHLTEVVAAITGVPKLYLSGGESLYNASIAARMSWAAHRTTTRTEDEAYCLLGLFNVSMPMVYGEGRKAFRRLQLQIIQQSTDQSIFAWTEGEGVVSIFAPSPSSFAGCGGITRVRNAGMNPYAITNNGLQLRTKLYMRADPSSKGAYDVRLIRLTCRDEAGQRVVLELEKGYDRYYRVIRKAESWRSGGQGRAMPKSGQLLGEMVIYLDTGVEDTVVHGSIHDYDDSESD